MVIASLCRWEGPCKSQESFTKCVRRNVVGTKVLWTFKRIIRLFSFCKSLCFHMILSPEILSFSRFFHRFCWALRGVCWSKRLSVALPKSPVSLSMGKGYIKGVLCPQRINGNYLKLLFYFQWTFRCCFRFYIYFWYSFWVLFIIKGWIVKCFY